MSLPRALSLSSRRAFLRTAAAGGVGLAALACGAPASSALDDAGTEPSAPDGGEPDAGAADAGATDDAGVLEPTCGEQTEPNIEGPFFSPDSPERTSLREPGMGGVLLLLEGRVLSTACAPLTGAVLDFWQADDEGAYDNQGFLLRGHQRVDGEGRYLLETIVPGRYLNGASYRPAHIHVKVSAPGARSLTTQLYFAGDPYNDTDPFIRPSLILDWREGEGQREAAFDFVLAPA